MGAGLSVGTPSHLASASARASRPRHLGNRMGGRQKGHQLPRYSCIRIIRIIGIRLVVKQGVDPSILPSVDVDVDVGVDVMSM